MVSDSILKVLLATEETFGQNAKFDNCWRTWCNDESDIKHAQRSNITLRRLAQDHSLRGLSHIPWSFFNIDREVVILQFFWKHIMGNMFTVRVLCSHSNGAVIFGEKSHFVIVIASRNLEFHRWVLFCLAWPRDVTVRTLCIPFMTPTYSFMLNHHAWQHVHATFKVQPSGNTCIFQGSLALV